MDPDKEEKVKRSTKSRLDFWDAIADTPSPMSGNVRKVLIDMASEELSDTQAQVIKKIRSL